MKTVGHTAVIAGDPAKVVGDMLIRSVGRRQRVVPAERRVASSVSLPQQVLVDQSATRRL